MPKLKLANKEIEESMEIKKADFPKYVSQIINWANQNAQGTRPKVVGKMSELVIESKSRNLDEWANWYKQNYPDAIQNAADKIWPMMMNLKNAIEKIDKKMVKDWVEDLVFNKTFLGIRFQEAILRRLSKDGNTTYRMANRTEESKGIDGFIGDIPVSIKPNTYKTMNQLPENIDIKMIYYSKEKGGVQIEYDDL